MLQVAGLGFAFESGNEPSRLWLVAGIMNRSDLVGHPDRLPGRLARRLPRLFESFFNARMLGAVKVTDSPLPSISFLMNPPIEFVMIGGFLALEKQR